MDNINLNAQDFFMKEVDYLRGGINSSIQETRSLERYALMIIGVIWSWCAAHPGQQGLKLIIWFPFFTTFLFGLRCWGIAKRIRVTDDYLGRLEGKSGFSDGFGWERHQAENRSPFEVKAVYLFWGILQAATFLVATWCVFVFKG
jgi:hypothetical protein